MKGSRANIRLIKLIEQIIIKLDKMQSDIDDLDPAKKRAKKAAQKAANEGVK